MGVSGQRHTPAALLPPGKGPQVPTGQVVEWASEPIWTQEAIWKILCSRRESNPDRPVVQPVVRHYTAWANPAHHIMNSIVKKREKIFQPDITVDELYRFIAVTISWTTMIMEQSLVK
jgi:hypothetical protein